MANGQSDENQQRFHRKAIGVHLAFAKIHSIIIQSRSLTLNAEVISAQIGDDGKPFGVVARELKIMLVALEKRVVEIEGHFATTVNEIAVWLKAERKLLLLQDAIRRLGNHPAEVGEEQAAEAGYVPDWGSPLEPGVTERWEKIREWCPEGDCQSRLWREIFGSRREIMSCLEGLDNVTRRIASIIREINRLAVRQSHFTAIAAMVEAARLEGHGAGLGTVALEIRALAGEIAGAEAVAKDEITTVVELAAALVTPLRAEIYRTAAQAAQ